MRVSGFTILRDGVKFGYPFIESLRSILDFVDEFIVNVGDCDDGTFEAVQGIASPKISIFRSVWDPGLFRGGVVMAHQTNLALQRCTGDWCFYLQGDEVVHENDLERIGKALRRSAGDPRVEGLTFRYLHFVGSYDIRDPLGYRQQVRIVRNGLGIESVKDACGFARQGRPLRTRPSHAIMYHYGWVRPPAEMELKSHQLTKLYEGASGDRDAVTAPPAALPAWTHDLRRCVWYRGGHPRVMHERIRTRAWELPDFRPVPRWRNLAWWSHLAWKNTRLLRRLTGRS